MIRRIKAPARLNAATSHPPASPKIAKTRGGGKPKQHARADPPELYVIRCSRSTAVEQCDEGSYEADDWSYGDGDSVHEAAVKAAAIEKDGTWIYDSQDSSGDVLVYRDKNTAREQAVELWKDMVVDHPFVAALADNDVTMRQEEEELEAEDEDYLTMSDENLACWE